MVAARDFRFGFLPSDWSFQFKGGSIEPLPDFAERWKDVRKRENPEDGFAYPPPVQKVRYPAGRPDLKEKVAGTERTTLLWSLPASHLLRLSSTSARNLEREDAWFLVNLLAYLFGVRLKPETWWFDGRVPLQLQRTHTAHFSLATANDFLARSYRTWRSWPKRDRHLLATLLHSHSRAASYEWDWERFSAEYTVLDSLWRVAERRRMVVLPPPRKRRGRRRGSLHGRRLRALG